MRIYLGIYCKKKEFPDSKSERYLILINGELQLILKFPTYFSLTAGLSRKHFL